MLASSIVAHEGRCLIVSEHAYSVAILDWSVPVSPLKMHKRLKSGSEI